MIVLIPIFLFHVLPAGGTGVCHELKLLCRTFHAGGSDDVTLRYSFLCSEAGPLV